MSWALSLRVRFTLPRKLRFYTKLSWFPPSFLFPPSQPSLRLFLALSKPHSHFILQNTAPRTPHRLSSSCLLFSLHVLFQFDLLWFMYFFFSPLSFLASRIAFSLLSVFAHFPTLHYFVFCLSLCCVLPRTHLSHPLFSLSHTLFSFRVFVW